MTGSSSPAITVLCHMYYQDSWDTMIKDHIIKLKVYNPDILINLCSVNFHDLQVVNAIKRDFPHAIIIKTPNIGKDIGGKLALIDLCLQLKKDTGYYILLHDKRSPHSALGNTWQKKLFRIIEPYYAAQAIELLERKQSTGIVAAKEFVNNEFNIETNEFKGNNNLILKDLIREFNLRLDAYHFIGGTMFWIRSGIIHDFFSRFNALDIRSTLEGGNVLDYAAGTQTHAWERMLSWISTQQGYNIKGI